MLGINDNQIPDRRFIKTLQVHSAAMADGSIQILSLTSFERDKTHRHHTRGFVFIAAFFYQY